MPTITINGQSTEVEPGATILAAAMSLGIPIPTLCHLDGVEPLATCMVCLVEDRRSGRLLPSCAALAEEGMSIETESAAARDARRTALELLLSEHAGECEAPCERACPLGIDIPELLDRLAFDGPEMAWRSLRATVALPVTATRVCMGGCEKACRRRQLDEPVHVPQLHADLAEWGLTQGPASLPERAASTGKRVAIVGGGLAGLVAADRLLTLGHGCTLYEQEDSAADSYRRTLAVSSPERASLDQEIEAIVGRGLSLRLGVVAGGDIPWSDLRTHCDVLVLATRCAARGVGTLGVEIHADQVVVDATTGLTTADGIVAIVSGRRSRRGPLARMLEGHEIAEAAHRVLTGDESEDAAGYACARLGPVSDEDLRALAANRLRRNGGLALVSDSGNAIGQEARRCLGCGCRTTSSCSLRRLCKEHGVDPRRFNGARRPLAPVEEHALVHYESGKCILCGRCVHLTEAAQEPLGLATLGRGFSTRICVPLNHSLAASLERSAAICADACPTGALTRRHDYPEGGSR